MAHCTSCGRTHAGQDAIEVAVAPNGAATILRCKLCGTVEHRRRKPEYRADVDVHVDRDMTPSEPISIEQARARTALLQQSLAEIVRY
jgi:uncharacterized Zn finger protein